MYSLKVAFIFNCCILVLFIQHKKGRSQPGKQRWRYLQANTILRKMCLYKSKKNTNDLVGKVIKEYW